VQHPHPPILIGGGGNRMLALAARCADIVGILSGPITGGVIADSPSAALPDAVARKVDLIREAAGDRFSGLELSIVVSPVVTQRRCSAAEEFARVHGWSSVTTEEVLTMPSALIGAVSAIAEHVTSCRERFGLSYIVVSDRNMDAFAPVVERLRAM
jgi:alkanesulfonate monooxygenase SsuD/methylene tetrahydromethanopterin reductase-like flavin-dependent oxidoreductase (luciferase family)